MPCAWQVGTEFGAALATAVTSPWHWAHAEGWRGGEGLWVSEKSLFLGVCCAGLCRAACRHRPLLAREGEGLGALHGSAPLKQLTGCHTTEGCQQDRRERPLRQHQQRASAFLPARPAEPLYVAVSKVLVT